MKLKISILASVSALSAFSVACGSTQKTEERSLGGNMIIDAANGQLAKVPVIGFPAFRNVYVDRSLTSTAKTLQLRQRP